MAGMPFDATMKDLIEDNARAWAERFNSRPVLEVAVVDADLSTVTAHADKVLRIQDAGGVCLLNIEAEGRHAADAPGRLLHYSVLLSHHHDGLPVRSVLLLLRSSANATSLTGTLQRRHRDDEDPYLVFHYRVVRLWEKALEPLLSGPIGLLPLAALTNEAEGDLPGVVKRITQRLRAETSREKSAKMETATFVLMGLRYEADRIERLFQEVQEMEDSTTYQLIIRRGEERGVSKGMCQLLLNVGRRKFGEPDAATKSALETITDQGRLDELGGRLLVATTWQELLS